MFIMLVVDVLGSHFLFLACVVGNDAACLTTEEPKDEPEVTPETPKQSEGPGHLFFLRPKGAYWTVVADCQRLGGNLACPRNAKQQQKIASIIRFVS
jgi:hypothetical protein